MTEESELGWRLGVENVKVKLKVKVRVRVRDVDVVPPCVGLNERWTKRNELERAWAEALRVDLAE